jgi:signal peptidase II
MATNERNDVASQQIPPDAALSPQTGIGQQAAVSAHRVRKLSYLLSAIAVVVVALDQWSKVWIRANVPLGGELPLWPDVVHLSHILNRGAAWGAFAGQRWMLVIVSLIVVLAVLTTIRKIAANGALTTIAMGFVLGGAVGNLIDRVLQGAVTDMIDLDTPWRIVREFPVFNLADSALTLGVILLAIYLLFTPEPRTPEDKTESGTDNQTAANR